MIKNIFFSALRKLFRNKTTTVVNILGLTLGVTVTIMIFVLLKFTLGYDRFHANYDKIYRIIHENQSNGNIEYGAGVPVPYYEAFKLDFNGLFEEAVFINESYNNRISFQESGSEKVFNEEQGVFFTQPNYFKVFSQEILEGVPQLDQPNTAVVSKSWAERMSKDGDVIGKMVHVNDYTFKITGIMADPQSNTDFPFQLLASYATIQKEKEQQGWGSVYSGDQIYLMLKDAEMAAAIDAKFPEFVKKNYSEDNATTYKPFLQPLSKLHYDSRLDGFSYSSAPMAIIYAFIAIGFFMILTACINFINLTTAMALKRTKEVGIRKIMGGSKWHIASIFWGETLIITSLAVLFSVILSDWGVRYLNQSFEMTLSLKQTGYFNLALFLAALVAFIVVVAATYPSWVLTRISPVLSIQNFYTNKATGSYKVRKGLVLVQFLIAQFFIVATLVLLKQMSFVKNMDMGFHKEGILNITPTGPYKNKMALLKEQIKSLEGVENATLTYTNPASGSTSATSFNLVGIEDQHISQLKYGDVDYIDTYGIQLIAGENLVQSDTINRIVVNETFASQAGFENPIDIIGNSVNINGNTVPVVGLVKDFNTMALRNKIYPTAIMTNSNAYRMISIKVNSANLTATTNKILDIVKAQVPVGEFEHTYLEEQINEFYQGEQSMTTLVSIFSGIVVFIGCLGLYGLVTFMVNIKVKEVGIRKVLGASVSQIVLMFTKEYSLLILIGFVIAAPLAGLLMNQWMQNYAFKAQIGAEVYIGGLLTVVMLALVTVIGKSIKAALANPVESLKGE